MSERQFRVILIGILTVNFVGAFDSTIMASTHPSVTSTFKSSNSASWLSTSFLLTSTCFQPLFGRLADIFGRRLPFAVSLFLFSFGTVWCALSQSVGSFIAARAVCGVGCGGIWTMGAVVLSDIIPIELRGTYQSWNNLGYGMGSMMGAALGGFMADTIGWRWVFGVQMPPALICTAIISLTIPEPPDSPHKQTSFSAPSRSQTPRARPRKLKKFDLAGSFFLLTSTALIIFGLSTGGNVFPWGSKIVMSSLIVGTLLWMVFIRVEKTAQAPIMPLKMVWSRPRNFLVGCNFLYMVATNSIIFNLPLYFQAVRLESATVAGGRLLIPSMATTLSAVSTGVIITYTGRLKPTLWLGTGLIIFGAILIATIGRDFSNLHYFFILIPLNLGIGFALPSTIMSMLAVSTQTDQAVATATLFLWRSLGCVLGVASGSLIVQNMLRIGLERYVDGSAWGRSRDEDAEVIEKVWKSVAALAELEERYRVQVQRAYEGALIGAFRWAVAAAVIGGAMVVAVKLPPLKGLDEYRKVEEEQQDLEDCEEDYAQVEGVEVGRGRN
ncbi:major facilitator superfamily domain-containing protein [Kalaharituber pfeilii]|nr:major facilitator superfamily domain-containing protein [Kalaharituber pfeilii]